MVFKSPNTYEFNNSCLKRNVVWGGNVNENDLKEKSISFWQGNVPYKTYYDVSLTEKDGKYYLKYKKAESDTEEFYGKGTVVTVVYKSR